MSLYISVNTPSAELEQSPIKQAIIFMAIQVAMEKRNGRLPQSGPALDVTFMLSSSKDAPDFQGMRMGGYSDANNTLYFETAVPEAISYSPLVSRYLSTVLQDVVDNAADYFAELNVPFDASHWSHAVNQLAEQEQPGSKPH